MREKEFTKAEIEINYALIRKIEEHARKYNDATDKKDFLRNVCAYEQKVILMNSTNPYEVLNYLDELDIESSRLILDELAYDEISKIISLFTSEDKEKFYSNFSNLELVNQFIMQDKNSLEYVSDLSIPRKVELIDSSNSETVLASSILYESIPENERQQVSDSLTNADAVSALSKTSAYKEDTIINELKSEQSEDIVDNKTITEQYVEEILEEEFDEKLEEQLREKIIDDEKLVAIKLFFMDRIKYYKENVEEFKNIDIDKEDVFESLPPELRAIIDKDFELSKEDKEEEKIDDEIFINNQDNFDSNYQNTQKQQSDADYYKKYSIIGNGESYVSIVSNPELTNSFQQKKQECEFFEIAKIKNEFNKDTDSKTL